MTPQELKQSRKAAGLSQTEAAALVYRDMQTWARWEKGLTPIDMACVELFTLKTAAIRELMAMRVK